MSRGLYEDVSGVTYEVQSPSFSGICAESCVGVLRSHDESDSDNDDTTMTTTTRDTDDSDSDSDSVGRRSFRGAARQMGGARCGHEPAGPASRRLLSRLERPRQERHVLRSGGRGNAGRRRGRSSSVFESFEKPATNLRPSSQSGSSRTTSKSQYSSSEDRAPSGPCTLPDHAHCPTPPAG